MYILLYFVSSHEQLLSGLHSNSITFQFNPFSPSTHSVYTLQILLINIFPGNNFKNEHKIQTSYNLHNFKFSCNAPHSGPKKYLLKQQRLFE